mgnify:CR=1 FL=1
MHDIIERATNFWYIIIVGYVTSDVAYIAAIINIMARREVVKNDNLSATLSKALYNMGTNESCTTSH